MNRMLIILLAALGMLVGGTAGADDFLCSDVGPVIRDDVDGNVFVDVNCTVRSGAFINGNMIQTKRGRSLTVRGGAEVNGNLEQFVNSRIVIRGGANINGNVEQPNRVICRNASVNGNVDDNRNCTRVRASCDVNGNICDN